MTGSFFYIIEKESVEPHTPPNLPMRRYIFVIGGGNYRATFLCGFVATEGQYVSFGDIYF